MRLLAALAGSAAIMAAGALTLASPASALAGHAAVSIPQVNAPTSIVLNALETDRGENTVTFGGDERDMSVVAHLTANGHSLLGTADIMAQVDGQAVEVCQITTWDQTSHFGDCSPPANDTVHPGTYAVTAFFVGTNVLGPSHSNTLTLGVTKEAANLNDIQDSSLSMTFGNETADKFNFTVTPEFPGDTPTGEVDLFFVGSGGGLCAAVLDNGSGSCTASDDIALDPGTYRIQAEYMGNGDFSPQFSHLATLTVSKGATNTTLVVPSDVRSGNSGLITAVVTSTFHGTPGGVVDFAVDGQTICHQMPLGENETAVCPSGRLSVGPHQLTASYTGDANFTGSSATQTLTIAKPSSKTSLTLSQGKPVYGDERAQKFTAHVAGPGGTATGTVTFKVDSTVIGKVSLSGGIAFKTLTAIQFKPGKHTITATYNGSAALNGSHASQSFTIVAEPTTTALTLSPAKVSAAHAEKLTVTVKPKFTGPAPAGKITIKAGTKTVCTITLTNTAKGTGHCQFTPRKLSLKPGTYTLIATYTATTPYTSSTAAKKTLTVTK